MVFTSGDILKIIDKERLKVNMNQIAEVETDDSYGIACTGVLKVYSTYELRSQ